MKIGLIDVDGHNFPNLALMRISAWHKAQGDAVEWWWTDFYHYDRVYMSKVFSDAYSQDKPEPMNADEVIKGGSGYAISLNDGRECFNKAKHSNLPYEIERCFPDYSIYPQYDFAVAMTSRGCPRGCPFCHVAAKEGRKAVKVANVSDFYCGQKLIVSLDPNITALPKADKRDLFCQYKETGAAVDFCQGLDIRMLTSEDIEMLNKMRLKNIHFAWDNPTDDLTEKFAEYAKHTTHKPSGGFGTVYCLTNFENVTVSEHIERALKRVYCLRDMGYDPYVMIYDKPHASKELKKLQRWCNAKWIFKSCRKFEDYAP